MSTLCAPYVSMVFNIFPKLSTALHRYPTMINVLFASFKLLTAFYFWKCLLKPSSKFPSLWLVDVLRCKLLTGCKEMRQIYKSQAAFNMILKDHRQLPLSISGLKSLLSGLWRGVTKGFAKLSSNLKKTSWNFDFGIFINNTKKKF